MAYKMADRSNLALPKQSWVFMTLKMKHLENIEGKGQNAGNQHFLLFPLNALSEKNCTIVATLLSAVAFNLDKGRILKLSSANSVSLWKNPFENIVRRRENAANQHFLLFAQCYPSIKYIL